MSQFVNRRTITLGCFALIFLSSELVTAQTGSQERPHRLIQSAADIAALPKSGTSAGVRAGFAPAQSSTSTGVSTNTNTGYQGSFYQRQDGNDVYPYPSSNSPTVGVGSQSAFALSQGSGSSFSNQVSVGSGTSTGNLSNVRIPSNTGFSNAGSATRSAASGFASNSNSNSRAPVVQQESSTLAPAAQARFNQAAVDRLRSQQTASNSNPIQPVSRPPTDRTASQANLFGQSGSSVLPSTSGFRQSTIPSTGGSTSRNTAATAPVARCAQACCCQQCPQCPQGSTPVTAGFQGAAFQAPSINPNVGAGLGLGTSAGVGGFNQQQCCQPQARVASTGFQQGFQGLGLQQGFQGVGLQQGFQGAGFGAGVPQFGAQGARWWTPFFRGTGAYNPIFDLTPNNAGTYLGQGILGQPAAYVNGQVLRNVLRYLTP